MIIFTLSSFTALQASESIPNMKMDSQIMVDAISVVNQNFEASKIPLSLPNTAQSYQRDLQLYGQQGGTPNVGASLVQLNYRFTPKNRVKSVGESGDTKLVIVTSSDIDSHIKTEKSIKENFILTSQVPVSYVIGSITVYPKDDGNVVDVNTLIYDVQKYLDGNYEGIYAVTREDLLTSTYGLKSNGNGYSINPSGVTDPGRFILGLAGAVGGNKANTRPVGYVGLTLFLTDKIDVAPPVIAVPQAPVAKKLYKVRKRC